MNARVFARWMVVAVVGFFAAAGAPGEVPNRSPEQLEKEASVIVTGPVVEHYTQSLGMQTRYMTVIRAERVEKGNIKVGENVTVRWGQNGQLPMTMGSSGHRGERVAIGHVVKVYAKGGTVVFPNGWASAEPLFVTNALLDGGDAEALVAAAKAAHEHGCFEEEGLAYAALVKKRDDPKDRLGLGTALWMQGRFKETVEALRPLAMRKSAPEADEGKAPEKPGKGSKQDRWSDPVQKARMMLTHALWDQNDREGYSRALVEFARVDDTREAWEWARETAEYLQDAGAQREAEKALKRLSKAGE